MEGTYEHGHIHIGFHFFREADYGTFIRYAMATFVSQIADTLRFKTAPIIIGSILGVAAVTPFAIAERICNLAAAICLLFSVSKQNFYAASNWLQASLTVGLAIVLTYYFGLTGTAIAISSMTFAVKLFIQPLGATSVLGMSIVRYHACHTLPNVALPAAFLAAFYFASRNYIAADYVTMFIIGVTAVVLFVPFTFFLGFNQPERAFLSKCILPARFRGKTAS